MTCPPAACPLSEGLKDFPGLGIYQLSIDFAEGFGIVADAGAVRFDLFRERLEQQTFLFG